MSAATDNVGLFFGEDIFMAIASILLIQGVFESYGYPLTPLQLSGLGDTDGDLRIHHSWLADQCI